MNASSILVILSHPINTLLDDTSSQVSFATAKKTSSPYKEVVSVLLSPDMHQQPSSEFP